MLSNTATPRYYGQFRDEVLAGKIPINKEIELQMLRIDDLIANPGMYYDDEAVEGFIEYCEAEMTLVDGSDVHVLDTFKLWAEDVLSWFYYTDRPVFTIDNNGNGRWERKRIKHRLRNKQYLIIGRGASKTLYDSWMQSYNQNIDTSTTDQIVTSPTLRQSEETLTPIITAMARSRGPLFKFLTEGSLQNTTGSRALRKKLCSTKEGIKNFLTNSIIRIVPMSIDKLQGLRCKYATVDEWLSCDIREDPIGAIEQGASKIDDYLIIATSSEGTVRAGPGDDIKLELMRILKGEYNDPHTSIWYYKLDDISEVSQPEKWLKANPNLGKTVSFDTYRRDVERAEKNPATRNDILAKRFGIPMEGLTYFFTFEETRKHPFRTFDGMPCALGGDMSRGDDFCAFSFMFPLSDGSFGWKNRAYITDTTYQKLSESMKNKYDDFIHEGTMVVMPGTILDMEEVYDDLDNFINEHGYDIVCFGYDPYNAKLFVNRWINEHGEFGVIKVIQGARTESVPLGNIKKLASEDELIFDEEIASFTMGNSIASVDNNGNYKLTKDRREQKIDCVAALMDAMVAYSDTKEAFY